MQQTGIVRRMDELGRVVIPKELRRTMRIREGEEVEVYQKDDALILRKFSAVGEMIDFQLEYAQSIYRTTGFTTIITDTDKVVAVSGDLEKCGVGATVSERLVEIMERRKLEILKHKDKRSFFSNELNKNVNAEVVAPIVANGDVMGSVVLYVKGEPNELAVKTAETAAHFLSQRL